MVDGRVLPPQCSRLKRAVRHTCRLALSGRWNDDNTGPRYAREAVSTGFDVLGITPSAATPAPGPAAAAAVARHRFEELVRRRR